MTYKEAEKQIYNLQRENGEVVLRCAINHLMDVGARHLTEEAVEAACTKIRKTDDEMSIMTPEFQCAILETAGKLAKIQPTLLLTYINRNIEYYVEEE